MKSETYNGWANYETWSCKLWLDEDIGFWESEAETIAVHTEDKGARVQMLADRLRDSFEESAVEQGLAGFFGDVIHRAIHNVNWEEIAEHYFEN